MSALPIKNALAEGSAAFVLRVPNDMSALPHVSHAHRAHSITGKGRPVESVERDSTPLVMAMFDALTAHSVRAASVLAKIIASPVARAHSPRTLVNQSAKRAKLISIPRSSNSSCPLLSLALQGKGIPTHVGCTSAGVRLVVTVPSLVQRICD